MGYSETGSVSEAARAVGMSRMAAYRLRRRPGAASLVQAWEAIMAFWRGEQASRRMVTAGEIAKRAFEGEFHILMRRRKFVRAQRKPSAAALLRHLRRLDAAAVRGGWDW